MQPICLPQLSAEDELLSLTYQALCETAASTDSFTHYLLAIAGLSVSTIILQLDSLTKFFSLESIFWCLCSLFTSASFGLLAKYFAAFRNSCFTTMETIYKGVDNITNRHAEDLDEQRFLERFTNSVPVISFFIRLWLRINNQKFLPFQQAFKFTIYQLIFGALQILFLPLAAIPLGIDMYSQMH